MRLRQFTPRKPRLDKKITPRDWKPDPKNFIKHDDLYARACECEYEQSIFDSDYKKPVTPNSPEITVLLEGAADKTSTTPGAIQKSSPENFPQVGRSCGGTDTYHYMEPDADTSVEQPDPTPTNPRSSKYDLRHNPKPKCNDNYGFWIRPTTVYGTHTYIFRTSLEPVMELICEMVTLSSKHLAVFLKQLQSSTDRTIQFCIVRYWNLDFHHKALNYPEMIYGTSILFPDTKHKRYKDSQFLEEKPCTATRFLLTLLVYKTQLL